MAQPGHADDCPGCTYKKLPAADQATLDASLFTDHTRKPPPPEPNTGTTKGVSLLLVGGIVGVIGALGVFGLTTSPSPAPFAAIPFALIGLAGFTALIAGSIANARLERGERRTRAVAAGLRGMESRTNKSVAATPLPRRIMALPHLRRLDVFKPTLLDHNL